MPRADYWTPRVRRQNRLQQSTDVEGDMHERWEVEWQELTHRAKVRRTKDPDGYEHDRDSDERVMAKVFASKAEAYAYARALVDNKKTVYGYVTIMHQRLIPVEGTLLNDWENVVDEPDYVE